MLDRLADINYHLSELYEGLKYVSGQVKENSLAWISQLEEEKTRLMEIVSHW